jgi:hypothetical protein
MSPAINLSNSFLDQPDILFIYDAKLVFAFVLNKYLPANAHTIIFQTFQPSVLLSNGHTLYQATHQIAVLLNTPNISLAISALSFLEIASCSHFAI